MSKEANDSWDLFLDEGDDGGPPLDSRFPTSLKDPPVEHITRRYTAPDPEPLPPPHHTALIHPSASMTDRPQAPRYVEVRFHPYRAQIIRNSPALPLIPGDFVVTEADRGLDLGQVVSTDPKTKERDASSARSVIRRATPQEIESLPMKLEREQAARNICQHKADEMGLPMTITATELQFDGKKLTVYFSASQYIDFRDLVHSLFRVFGMRIWMVWYDGEAPVRDVFTHTSPHVQVTPPARRIEL